MSRLSYNSNKVLRLQNVLIAEFDIKNENMDYNIVIEKMQSYIKIKGAVQIGPLVQHTKTFVNDKGEWDMEVHFMLQCNNYIYSVENPYFMEPLVRIPNCLYCRYVGPEEKLKIAYDKISVEAFENDIDLAGENYTVFVDSNEEEGTILADVFMPKKKGE